MQHHLYHVVPHKRLPERLPERLRERLALCVLVLAAVLAPVLSTALGAISSTPLYAQTRTVTGTVTDGESKKPLAGAKVVVKGSNIGTLTGKDGTFRLSVPEGGTIVVSYIGLRKQELSTAEKTSFEIALAVDSKLLDDVVVTAFGVEREKRAINYAVQDVKAGEIVESAQQNVINALQGRIAGVQITNSGGAPGAGSSIIIRGGNSVDSDNQPLFVIDGVPMDNNTTGETNAGTSSLNGTLARSASNSNRAMDLNPEDIESMSVLKGPAGAALYGLRAANGVVIITTKRGFKERMEIVYSSNFSWDVVNKLPAFQDQYKQGTQGFFDSTTRNSWGPRFASGEAIYDNVGTLFRTGFSQQHNLTMSGASDKLNFLFSASLLDQQGIVPNTRWGRISLRFNGGATLLPGLRLNTSINYTNSGGNRVMQGRGLFNFTGGGGSGGYFFSTIYWPRNDNMRDWQNPDGSRRRLLQSITNDTDNPYFTINKAPMTDVVDRVLANGTLSYDPIDWLNLTYRAGVDITSERNMSIRPFGSSSPDAQLGAISQSKNNRVNFNSQVLLMLKPKLIEGVKTDLLLGSTIETEYFNALDYYGRNFINPDFISINNTVVTENRFVERITERRLLGVFGSLNIGVQDKLYLTLTARNDWSSTLPLESRSFFYWSATAGYVFSEDLQPLLGDVLSFGRIRGSISRVGKDAAPYRVGTALTANTFVGGGFRNDFWGGNPTLRPETTEGIEAGLDLRFFDNRLNFDLTFYRQRTYDQLIAPRISQASGFIFAYLNGGTVQNQGIEFLVSGTPLRSADFSWNIGVNFARNISTVVELPSVLSELVQNDAQIIDIARGSAFPGQPLQAIAGQDYQRSPEGRVIIDSASGQPLLNSSYLYLGNRQPDAIIGLTNTFTYDNFTFSFLWDFRVGGKIVNGTEWEMVRAGVSTRTLDRYKQTVVPGVVRRSDGTFVENTRPIQLTENYLRLNYGAAASNFVEDGSWARLRTVTLSYRIPKSVFEGSPINGLELTLTGRNLLLFTSYTGMDPEVSAAGSGVRGSGSNGFDYAGVPNTRGITAGVRLTF
jgi:TonB-linked SusC/RagA family outer membrane protein